MKLFSLKSLNKKLFFYMLGLAGLTLTLSFLSLFFIGVLKSEGTNTINSIKSLADMYSLRLSLHFGLLSAMSDDMVKESRGLVEEYLESKDLSFDDLKTSKEYMDELKSKLSGIGTLEISSALSSGFVVALDGSYENNELFAGFKAGDRNKLLTLSDRKLYFLRKIYGSRGELYGICVYEIDEAFFEDKYTENTDLKEFTSLLFSEPSAAERNTAFGMNLSGSGKAYNTAKLSFREKEITKNLYEYKGEGIDCVGISKDIILFDKAEPLRLYVMTTKEEYESEVYDNIAKITAQFIFMLILVTAVSFVLSKKYAGGLASSVEKLKNTRIKEDGVKLPTELEELHTFLKEENEKKEKVHNEKISVLKQEIKRLEYDRKKEIDPENFQSFIEGINALTKTEKKIFDLYREGYSAKEILEIANIKESTLRYHNQNIYSKLSVNSLKLMLRYCTLMENNSAEED